MGRFVNTGRQRWSRLDTTQGKAVVVKNTEDGTSRALQPHLVAATDRYPCKATAAAMGKKEIAKRSKIKSFAAFVTMIIWCPQGLAIPLDKTVASKDVFRDPALEHKA
ncbi:60S ribosomal protein L27 [Sciurus carolinensis]|uniref:60S ribosomal protein L27 n=1 Tax=Sciurus carolinensis TaxID=30640 RepID=A0AA41T3P8_SCICA|nr:60S ribosomal protein L27 [Sciurus carolinensis]